MATITRPVSSHRKAPVQSRAIETVEAICEAAIQLLLKEGPTLLTTIRIAKRAGVSVGTYYQYFPNKEALLLTLISRHLRRITKVLEQACRESHGKPQPIMVSVFLHAYVAAQLEDRDVAKAVYRVVPDVGAGAILAQQRALVVAAIAAMLRTAPELPEGDIEMIAFTFFAAISGATRAVLETSEEVSFISSWEPHLERLGHAYLASFSRQA